MARYLANQRMGMVGRPHPIFAGGPTAMGIITERELAAYDVNRDGWEAIRQGLYDSQAYAAAGASVYTFFLIPQGSGTGFGGGTKTISDTNMTLAGQMPAMQKFLVESVAVDFWPTTPTVAAAMPASTVAAASQAVIVNDVYIFRRSGVLTLTIGSKEYLQEGPMNCFPSKTHYNISAVANATGTGDTSGSHIAWADTIGRPYHITPYSVLLIASQNFNVTLTWPEGVQAITNPARVFVRLDGVLYRRSQ